MVERNTGIPAALKALDETKLLALCIYGEARGEKQEGKIAVASVIMNRVTRAGWFGTGIKGVILKPKQFSCFNGNDPNYLKLMVIATQWETYFQKDKHLRECCFVAEGVISGTIKGTVGNACFYHALNCRPSWSGKMIIVATIGNHVFYTEASKYE